MTYKETIETLRGFERQVISPKPNTWGEMLDAIESEVSRLQEDGKKYMELLYAVAQRFPNESRHETALRIIQENQNKEVGGPSTAAMKDSQ